MKVRCIEKSKLQLKVNNLTFGKVYEVIGVDNITGMVRIVDDKNLQMWIFNYRFEEIKEEGMEKYVKLIDDATINHPTWAKGNGLTLGKVYKVDSEDSDFYRVIDDSGSRSTNCFKTRFSVVEKENTMKKVIAKHNWKNQYGSITAGKTYNVTEESTTGYFVKNNENTITHLSKSYFNEVVETKEPVAPAPSSIKKTERFEWSERDTAYCIDNTSVEDRLTVGKGYKINLACYDSLNVVDNNMKSIRLSKERFTKYPFSPVTLPSTQETYKLPDGMVLTGTATQIQAYLEKLGIGTEGDGIHYVSSTKGLVKIADMNTGHLKNAFLKKYREWVESLSGMDTTTLLTAVRSGNTDKTFIAMLKELLNRKE